MRVVLGPIIQQATARPGQLNRARLARVRDRKPKTSVRVLFADDDLATREGYAAYLTNCGYDLMPVATGREAVTLASSWMTVMMIADETVSSVFLDTNTVDVYNRNIPTGFRHRMSR